MESDDRSRVHELLTGLICSLVDRPEFVEVVQTSDAIGTTFRVEVLPSDVGKLIGKNGRTAHALRVILSANAAKLQQIFRLDIVQKERQDAGSASDITT